MAAVILLISLLIYLPSQGTNSTQSTKPDPDRISAECSQPASERDSLIREAEEGAYTIRWVVFARNTRTPDRVLRRKLINLNEGGVFTRANLAKSLASVSKVKKYIHPVKLDDATISLAKSEKLVDMEVCLTER
jgi:outer membrane protein assembly factor BamA